MRRIILVGLLLGFLSGAYDALGQNEQMFTQYMYNKMAINPGYAGNDDYWGLTAHVREQWNGFPGAPEAQLLSVNAPRFGRNIGVGLNLRRRTIGIHRELTVSGIYAYKFLLKEGTLSLGLEVSGRNRVSDFTDERLVASQGIELDPSIPATSISRNYANIGFGAYYNTKNFFIGASVPRLAKVDIDFDDNDVQSLETRHLFIMGGATFRISDDLKFTAQSLLKFAENSPFDADITTSLTLQDKYTAGVGYRLGGAQGDVGESVALILAFNLTDQFMVGFSQDFTLSKIRSYDNGSFELVASYAFGKKDKKAVMLNPRFF